MIKDTQGKPALADFARPSSETAAPPSTSTLPAFTRLLDLPPELCKHVYGYYFELEYDYRSSYPFAENRTHLVDWPTLHVYKDNPSESLQPRAVTKFLPNIALTSHQVRAESVRVLLRSTDQIVLARKEATRYFSTFVDSFKAHDLVHTLVIHQYDRGLKYEQVAALNLIEQCPNLRALEIITNCGGAMRDYGKERSKQMEYIVAELKLTDILQCQSLRQLQFTGSPTPNSLYATRELHRRRRRPPPSWRVMSNLVTFERVGAWFSENFENQGQQVSVHVSTRESLAVLDYVPPNPFPRRK